MTITNNPFKFLLSDSSALINKKPRIAYSTKCTILSFWARNLDCGKELPGIQVNKKINKMYKPNIREGRDLIFIEYTFHST